MVMLLWVLVGLLAWCAVSLPLAIVVGRTLRGPVTGDDASGARSHTVLAA